MIQTNRKDVKGAAMDAEQVIRRERFGAQTLAYISTRAGR